MKKSFTILELILSISLIFVLYTLFIPKVKNNKLEEVTNRLVFYLKQTRYQALIDNKYSQNDSLWYKKRWTLKFFRCRKNVGGFYYTIYSDKNNSGHPSKEDSLKDPLTNKNIYSSNFCQDDIENSKHTLLTKYYDITDINVSCNSTKSIGQISFSNNGKVYSKLSNFENSANDYEILEPCIITLYDKNNNSTQIQIENRTSFVKRL